MSYTTVVTVLASLGTGVFTTWIIASAGLSVAKGHGPDWVNRLWYWLKWPSLVNVFLQPVTVVYLTGRLTFGDYFAFSVNICCWYVWRNAGDDDFTKKLKKKLTETVARVGNKLVLVPTRTA